VCIRSFEVQQNNQQSPEMGGESAALAPQQPMFRRDSLEINDLVAALIGEIDAFKELIEKPRTVLAPVETTIGKMEPLGQEKLNLVMLLAELLHVENGEIFKKYHTSKIFILVLDLFFAFVWNNLLHHLVYDLMFSLFQAPIAISRDCIESVLLCQIFAIIFRYSMKGV
jgi:hypothetical protein